MNPDETDQDRSGIRALAMNPGSDQDLSEIVIKVTDLDEMGQDQSGIVINLGLDLDLSEIGIEATDPGLNQDQSGISTRAKDPGSDQDESRIRAKAMSPASDRDASGHTVDVTAPGLNLDQYGISRRASDPRSGHKMSGIRAGATNVGTRQVKTRSMMATSSSTTSVRKDPRHVHEKHKGGAQAECCHGESRWTIMTNNRGVMVEVREKRGELRSAIPTMAFPFAIFCLVLNTFLPGMGTFVSAFAVLCGAPTDQDHRHICVVFLLNVAAALIQLLTAVVIVGWIMSIFWGMDMVILATYRTQDTVQHI